MCKEDLEQQQQQQQPPSKQADPRSGERNGEVLSCFRCWRMCSERTKTRIIISVAVLIVVVIAVSFLAYELTNRNNDCTMSLEEVEEKVMTSPCDYVNAEVDCVWGCTVIECNCPITNYNFTNQRGESFLVNGNGTVFIGISWSVENLTYA